MKIRLTPIETITINTGKSDADVFASLIKTPHHRIGSTTKITSPDGSGNFIIERTLNDRSRTVIIANGIIYGNGNGKTIFIHVTVKKDKRFLPGIFLWYSVNFLFFVAFIFILIKDHEFRFFVLLPLVFILLGYGLTTLMMQGAIDELIVEIKKAVK